MSLSFSTVRTLAGRLCCLTLLCLGVLATSAHADITRNLFGYWPMDGSRADVSGNNRTLSIGLGGAPVTDVDGKFNQCYRFDNITSGPHVFTAGAINIPTTVTGITVTAWINPDTLKDGFSTLSPHVIAHLFKHDDVGVQLSLRIRDKKLDAYYTDPSANNSSGITITTNTWTFVACTLTSTVLKLSVNGQAPTTFTVNSLKGPFTRLYLGSPAGSGTTWRGLAGRMDEVRVYTRALTETEIADVYQFDPTYVAPVEQPNLTRGLVGAWPLDGNYDDISGNNLPLTAPGLGGEPQTTDTGRTNGCYSFNNSTTAPQLLALAENSFQIPDTAGMSFTAWINPSTLGASGFTPATPPTIFHMFTNGAGKDMILRIRDTKLDLYYTSPAANNLTTFTVPTDTWSFVAVTQSGTQLKVYFNNETPKEFTVLGNIAYNQLYVGALGNNTSQPRAFNGLIDEVSVYNRPLSDEEIALLRSHATVGWINAAQKWTLFQ